MAATVRADYYGASGSEPAGSTAETGIVHARQDTKAPAGGVAPIVRPDPGPGTDYSWIKLLALNVTAGDATSISARTIAHDGDDPDAGLAVFFADQPTYRQPGSGNVPPAEGTDGPETPAETGSGAPAAYAEVTQTPAGWDSGSDSAAGTGRNGNFVELVCAVDSSFAGGAGQHALPDLLLAYVEA